MSVSADLVDIAIRTLTHVKRHERVASDWGMRVADLYDVMLLNRTALVEAECLDDIHEVAKKMLVLSSEEGDAAMADVELVLEILEGLNAQ